MKELPNEKTLLEILELAKEFEQSARELCELSLGENRRFVQSGAINSNVLF